MYTARHLKCSSPIENAYNSSTIAKKVQNTKVVFGKSTEPSRSKEGVSRKATVTITPSGHEEKIDFPTDQFSRDQKIESLTQRSQNRKSCNANAVVRKRQSTLSFSIKNKKCKAEEGSVESSDEGDTQREDEVYTICDKEDPPGDAKIVKWIDRDVCHAWCHLSCAKQNDSGWRNIRRKSWVCQ